MRRFVWTILALLVVAAAAWAGDPWKQKAYKDWNENDLRQIMNDSPWAKQVKVNSTGMPSNSEGVRPDGAMGTYGGGVPVTAGMMMNQMVFSVRWTSALTFRRASVRAAVSLGRMSEADAEKSLAAPRDQYTIVIVGQSVPFTFNGLSQTALERATYLRPKRAKRKLAPARAEIEYRADGKTIEGITFCFAKKLENGDPAIAADEKSIEFVCEPKGISIRTEFEPLKMVAEQGVDM